MIGQCITSCVFRRCPRSPRLADPAPDHVGVDAVIQRDPGGRCTGFQALGDNLRLEFPRKPATMLVGLGYAYVDHVRCPLEISGHYPDGDSVRLKMGLPDADVKKAHRCSIRHPRKFLDPRAFACVQSQGVVLVTSRLGTQASSRRLPSTK